MKRKQIFELVIGAVVLLGIALFLDIREQKSGNDHVAKREIGEGSTELTYEIKGVDGITEYTLEVPEKLLDEQSAMGLFEAAEREMKRTIFFENENANEVYTGLRISNKYVDGQVRASWNFNNGDVIDAEGLVIKENLQEDQYLVTAEVTFKVQQYETIIEFDFLVLQSLRTEEEQLLYDIEKEIVVHEDNENIYLPTEVDGTSLQWKKKGENYFGKILFLEILAVLGIGVFTRRKNKQETERERTLMKYDYSEIVGKYGILLGAGMSPKQVWYNISASYLKKRKEKKQKKRRIYEEMLTTYYELQGGEYEAEAYLKFGKRVQIASYNRFIRLINQINTKGSRGVSALLQAEATGAFDERLAMAKKLGEEASTKMLFPMILMMGVLFAIIIMPAAVEFTR